jgi:opacity protein-like surface antigen
MKSLFSLLGIALLLLCAAAAADVAGTWKASMEGGAGGDVTWVFKVDGNKITGTANSESSGEVPITDGKIEGNNISFTVSLNFNGQPMKIFHKGTVNGSEMKLTVQFEGQDQTMEMTAKKVS